MPDHPTPDRSMRFLNDADTRQRVEEACIASAVSRAFAYRDDARHVAYDWHHHDHHQLLYAVQGIIHLETAERRFLLPSQRAAWIPAGLVHRTWLEDFSSCSVFFSADDPDCPPIDELRIVAAPPLMREMIIHAQRWQANTMDRRPPQEILLADRFFSTLALLCGEWLGDEVPFHLPTGHSPSIRRAMDFVNTRLADAPMAQAARAAGLSERSLRRKFAEETGMGWQDYVNAARMMRAMAHLAEESGSVATAADEVGFGSLSAFSKAFTRFTGENPGRYRRRVRDGGGEIREAYSIPMARL